MNISRLLMGSSLVVFCIGNVLSLNLDVIVLDAYGGYDDHDGDCDVCFFVCAHDGVGRVCVQLSYTWQVTIVLLLGLCIQLQSVFLSRWIVLFF